MCQSLFSGVLSISQQRLKQLRRLVTIRKQVVRQIQRHSRVTGRENPAIQIS